MLHLKCTHLFIIFGIKDCHSSGKNLIFYLFIKTVIKFSCYIKADGGE
jgi:hypothetical protein